MVEQRREIATLIGSAPSLRHEVPGILAEIATGIRAQTAAALDRYGEQAAAARLAADGPGLEARCLEEDFFPAGPTAAST